MTRHGQLDVTSQPSGTNGYEDLVQHASEHLIPGTSTAVRVASAADIIRSKTAAGRPKDIAMLPALRRELARWLDDGSSEASRGCRVGGAADQPAARRAVRRALSSSVASAIA
jgi:hypothetical protein